MSPAAIIALCGIAAGGASHAASVEVEWVMPANGDWFDPARWSGGVAPNNSEKTTYAVTLGGEGSYTVTLGASATIDSLAFDANAVLSVGVGGELSILDSLTLGPGQLWLRGGTARGGVWTGSTGVIRFDDGSSLRDLTLAGMHSIVGASAGGRLRLEDIDLDAGADVRLGSEGENFEIAGSLVVRNGASLRAGGRVGNGVNFHSGLELRDGATLLVEEGGLLSFAAPGIVTGDGTGLLRNEGVLNSGVPPTSLSGVSPEGSSPSQWLTIDSAVQRFENAGVFNVANPGATTIASIFQNDGEVVVHSGTLNLLGDWANSGTIEVAGANAALVLGGSFSTSSTQALTRTQGSIYFDGQMDNTGQITTLTSNDLRWIARGGVVEGGTIDGRGALAQRALSGMVTVRNASVLTGSTWNLYSGDDVVVEGASTITGATFLGLDAGRLTLGDGVLLPSGIRTDINANALLTFRGGDYTLEGADLRVAFGGDITVQGDSSLTLDAASRFTVTQGTSSTTISGSQGARELNNYGEISVSGGGASSVTIGSGFAEFVNHGSIMHQGGGRLSLGTLRNEADAAVTVFNSASEVSFFDGTTNHGQIVVQGADTSFSRGVVNTGTIIVDGAALSINTSTFGGAFANTGSVALSDGALTLGGTYTSADINNISFFGDWSATAQGVWDNTGSSLDLGALSSRWTIDGEIIGGDVRIGVPGMGAATPSLVLRDVAVLDASLELGAPDDLTLADLALAPGMSIEAAGGAALRLQNSQFPGASLTSLASGAESAATLELEGSVEIDADTRILGRWDIRTDSLVNRGLIRGNTGDAVDLRLDGDSVNWGTIESAHDLSIVHSGAEFVNHGVLTAQGTLDVIGSSFTNSGSLVASDIALSANILTNTETVSATTLSVIANAFNNEGVIQTLSGAFELAGINSGEMLVNGDSTLAFREYGVGAFENAGSIRIENGATLSVVNLSASDDGNFLNTGELVIGSGSTLRIERELNAAALAGIANHGLLDIQDEIDNTGGVFSPTGDGRVLLSDRSKIVGGTVDLNGGTLEMLGYSGFSSFRRRLDGVGVMDTDIANDGGVEFVNGFFHEGGAIHANGSLRIVNPRDAVLTADEVNLNGYGLYLEQTDSIAASTFIRGAGVLSTAGSTPLALNGFIENASGGLLRFDGIHANAGVIRAANGSSIEFQNQVNNSGLLEASGASTLSFNRITGNTGTIRATGGSTLDLLDSYDLATPPDVGQICVIDSTLVWNSGYFDGTISLERSDLRLSGVAAPWLINRFDLDESSRLLLGFDGGAEVNLGGSHYTFDREVVLGEVTFREGTVSLPQPLDGELSIFFDNAQYLDGDITLRGNSAFGTRGDAAPNGVVRNFGDSAIRLSLTPALGGTFINEAGDLTLRATANSNTRIDGLLHIRGGSATVTASPLLYVPRITNYGELRVESQTAQTVVFSSAVGSFDNQGLISVGSGGRVEFDPRLTNISSLLNFDIPTRALNGGRYVVEDGGMFILRGGPGVRTNNADVEIIGSGRFDAITSFLQLNNGSIALRQGASMLSSTAFVNEGEFVVDRSHITAFSLTNNASLTMVDPDITLAFITFGASSTTELTITGDTAPSAPLIRTTMGANLGGSLALAIEHADNLVWGDRYEALRLGSATTGAFAMISGPGPVDGLAWETEWLGNSLFVRARDWADINDDGAVDFADLNGVLAAYGSEDGAIADIDGDGVVGFSDLNIVLSRYGAMAPSAIPAPGAIVCLSGATMFLLRRRRDTTL